MTPHTNARKEMALCVANYIYRMNVTNISIINVSWGDMPRHNQVTQPLCSKGVNFIVVSKTHKEKPPIFAPMIGGQAYRPDLLLGFAGGANGRREEAA